MQEKYRLNEETSRKEVEDRGMEDRMKKGEKNGQKVE